MLPIPALTFPLTMDFCPEGTQQKGPLCTPCDQQTFNFDGVKCLQCPTGMPWRYVWNQKVNPCICRDRCTQAIEQKDMCFPATYVNSSVSHACRLKSKRGCYGVEIELFWIKLCILSSRICTSATGPCCV